MWVLRFFLEGYGFGYFTRMVGEGFGWAGEVDHPDVQRFQTKEEADHKLIELAMDPDEPSALDWMYVEEVAP